MLRFPDPTIFVAACSTRHQLARQVRFLREENRILKAKLPERISTTPEERSRLLRFGVPLGDAIKGLISIVKPGTFARWVRRGPGRRRAGRTGRPRKPEEIRVLIVRIARETGWGSTRVLGELRKLGITNVSRTTVRRILNEHGIDPAPKRRGQSWDEFIRAHAETLWACDFFTKTVWTPLGPRLAFVLFFLHVGSRRVTVSEPTLKPTREWSAEQASIFLAQAETDGHEPPKILLRDRDDKFGPAFDQALADAGCRVQVLPIRSPILNAFAERWVQSVKRECLDHFIVFGLGHLAHLLVSWVDHYHGERPHQGLGNRLIAGPDPPESPSGPFRCRTRLGGVRKSYERIAA